MIKFDHDLERGLCGRLVRVLEHLEHEVLQRGVEAHVLALGVGRLDVVDDVVAEVLPEDLVLALEQVEEEGEQVGRPEEVLPPHQDQRLAHLHTHLAIKDGGVAL